MPIKVNWEEEGVHFECTGIVSKDEVYDAIIEQFYNVEESLTVKYEIFDCSSTEDFQITDYDAVIFASYDIGRSMSVKNMKVAFIADQESIVRKFRIYIDHCKKVNKNWSFELFETVDAAKKWIIS